METIIKSEVFDHHNKTYLLDRFKADGTDILVRITEIVHEGGRQGKHVVVFKEAVFERIHQFMRTPAPSAPTSIPVRKPPFLTGDKCTAIVRNYLKGVTSKALALQYNCKAADIESLLRREGIEVVDQEPKASRPYSQKWRRK